MTRTWTRLALAALLAALLTPAARADTVTDDLKAIKKQLDEMNRRLGTDLGTMNVQIQTNVNEIQDLRRRVKQLEEALSRISSQPRRAMAFTPDTEGPPVPRTGTIVLQNTSAVPVTVLINGRSYAAPAGETHPIERVPTGAFTYEVLMEDGRVIRPAVARTLTAGARHYIYIYP